MQVFLINVWQNLHDSVIRWVSSFKVVSGSVSPKLKDLLIGACCIL